MRARSSNARLLETPALILRRTPYGEADLIVTLFTESAGRLSALARSARKSQRRFGGSLEPLHTLEVQLDERPDSDVLTLREARLVTVRTGLLEDLARLEAAGRYLGWIRQAAPERTPEPALWRLCQACLDDLNAGAANPGGPAASAALTLAHYGLGLLEASGWRLELERCVQSGVPCPEGKAAMIDPERGGLVSRAQGGASISVSGAQRARLIAAQRGDAAALTEEDAELGLRLVERCLKAHAGI
jgi:DNA repair protein RecO (recombination protein O)